MGFAYVMSTCQRVSGQDRHHFLRNIIDGLALRAEEVPVQMCHAVKADALFIYGQREAQTLVGEQSECIIDGCR